MRFERGARHASASRGAAREQQRSSSSCSRPASLYGTPLLYAALGELLAERSGVLNLGVEGMMLDRRRDGLLGRAAVARRVGLVAAAAIGVAAIAGARDGG